MGKVKCVLSYDGTNYSGFQIQPTRRTVQGEIEQALQTMHKGEHIRIYGSGRTDKGVHAKGQTIHFQPTLQLPVENWRRALNTLLPDDIHIHRTISVSSDFHARYGAVETEYRYYLQMNQGKDVFIRNYVYQTNRNLNIGQMQAACAYFQGTHDFTTFSSAKATIKGSKVRTLSTVRCEQNGDEIVFIFKGNGFLYHMVRLIVSALFDIGLGKRQPEDIPQLMVKKDRTLLGMTIPPQGLYLWNVTYE